MVTMSMVYAMVGEQLTFDGRKNKFRYTTFSIYVEPILMNVLSAKYL